MKIILIICFLAVGSFADDLWLETYAGVYHWNREYGYNEDLEYVGLVYEHNNVEFGAARYINSYGVHSESYYVGYKKELTRVLETELGLFFIAGYRTGYGEHQHILMYGGVYAEYDRFYIKTAINGEFIGATIGYKIHSW